MKEKLQQLLAPLAQKLPFLQKFIGGPSSEDSLNDEETGVHEVVEEEEIEEKVSLFDKIKGQIPFLNKKKSAEGTRSDEDRTDPGIVVATEDESDGSKSLIHKLTGFIKRTGQGADSPEGGTKKKLKPVHIIVIVLILVVVLFSDEEKKLEEAPKKPAQAKKMANKPAMAETSTASEAELAPETTVLDDSPPSNLPTGPEKIAGEKTEVVSATSAGGDLSHPVSPIDHPGAVEGLEDLTSGIKLDEDDDGTEMKDREGTSSASDHTETSKVSQEGLKELEGKIAEKKNKKNRGPQVDYVAPPDYEMQGRGLVYSCKGKHWACVTGAGYGQCEKNFAYNEQHKEKIECYPDNVYMTDDDCVRSQLEKINQAIETKDLCKI